MSKSPLSQEEIDVLVQAGEKGGKSTDGDSPPVAPPSPAGQEFAEFDQDIPAAAPSGPPSMDLVLDIPVDVAVELGRTRKLVKEVLAMVPGSVVELDRQAGEPVDVMVNGKLLARGEVVVIDENFGVRISEVISRSERLANMR